MNKENSIPNHDRFMFRVWDNLYKRYATDSYDRVTIDTDGNVFVHVWIDGVLRVYGNNIFKCKNRFVVEQCTGIRDKTGTLIYEGDVVTLYPIETKYHRQRVVTWLHDHWTTVRKYTTGANIYWSFGHHEIKVIGNIHTMSVQSVKSVPSVKSPEPLP